jgi:hypothetical protein
MYYQDYENKVDEVNFIMHSLLTCVSCKLEYIHLHYQDYENKLDEVNFIMHNSFVTNITVLRITLKLHTTCFQIELHNLFCTTKLR